MLFSAPSCPWKWWWCLWKCRFLVLMLQKDPLVFEWSTIIISYSLCRPCIGSVYRWFSYNLSDKNWFQSLPTKMHVQNSWRKKSKQDNPFNSKNIVLMFCIHVLCISPLHYPTKQGKQQEKKYEMYKCIFFLTVHENDDHVC